MPPIPKTGPLHFYETVVFYRHAPEDWVEQFESLLDKGDEKKSYQLIQKWFDSYYQKSAVAKKPREEYTKEPPQVGDMVIVIPTGRFARLIAISDDKKICVIKEQYGAYPIPYEKVVRAR